MSAEGGTEFGVGVERRSKDAATISFDANGEFDVDFVCDVPGSIAQGKKIIRASE